jgi:prefoldin subunit 5
MKVLRTGLAYIHANFSILLQSITKLEKATNLLSETIKEINNIQDKPNKTKGLKVDAAKQKLSSFFSKNKGYKVRCEI